MRGQEPFTDPADPQQKADALRTPEPLDQERVDELLVAQQQQADAEREEDQPAAEPEAEPQVEAEAEPQAEAEPEDKSK
jgi:hypothetical protein